MDRIELGGAAPEIHLVHRPVWSRDSSGRKVDGDAVQSMGTGVHNGWTRDLRREFPPGNESIIIIIISRGLSGDVAMALRNERARELADEDTRSRVVVLGSIGQCTNQQGDVGQSALGDRRRGGAVELEGLFGATARQPILRGELE